MKTIATLIAATFLSFCGNAQINMALVPATPYGTPGARNMTVKLTFANGGTNYSGQAMLGYFFILKTPASCGPVTPSNFSNGNGFSNALVYIPSQTIGAYNYTFIELNEVGTAPATWVYPNEVDLVTFTTDLADGCSMELAPDNDPDVDFIIDNRFGTDWSLSLYGSDINMVGSPTVVSYYSGLHTLPVRLTSFNVAVKNCSSTIKWTTDLESDLLNYSVEYSNDGVHFTAAGNVAPAGAGAYTFNHTPAMGKAYYRLKMTENTGKIIYSNVVLANISCGTAAIQATVYPSPVKSGQPLNISLQGFSGSVQGMMYSLDGKQVAVKQLINGSNQIATTNIAAGMYQLVITDAAGNRETRKVVIAN